MTTYRYPFESEVFQEVIQAKKDGKEIHQWVQPGVDLQALFLQKAGPILEIGGPSDGGYFFLHEVDLTSPVTITNQKANPLPFAPDAKALAGYVEKLVDGRSIPYLDNSLAIVMMQHMSVVDDSQYDFSDLSDEADQLLWKAIARSRELEHQIAQTGQLLPEAFEVCLRLAIAKEVHAKLQPGGLFLTDATADQRKVFELLGFSRVAELDRSSIIGYGEPHYDIVFIKQ